MEDIKSSVDSASDAYASDAATAGLSVAPIDALRYDNQPDDPDEVAGILHRMMPTDMRVLDVGCGTGSVTLIANRGKRNHVVALEPNEERCRKAQSRGIDARHGFLDSAFVAANGPFDIVMSSDVLEHMVDPSVGLQSFGHALRPGGILLISVPNVAHWSVRANLLFGRFRYAECGIMDATHVRWFTQETLVNLVHSSGFEIESLRVTAGFDLPVYTVGRLRKLPVRFRRRVLRAGIHFLPKLFGAQFVIKARLLDA